MSCDKLLVCLHPRGTHWQLGPLDGTADGPLLLGWRLASSSVDEGLPPAVAHILGRSLVRVFRVTGLNLDSAGKAGGTWTSLDGDFVRWLPAAKGHGARGMSSNLPEKSMLVSTCNSATVEKMLDDADFPWWMQGQLLLLSDPTAPFPPNITREDVAALAGPSWWKSLRIAAGLLGMMRPGVDGQVAGLFVPDRALRKSYLAVLQAECHAGGFTTENVDMVTFARLL